MKTKTGVDPETVGAEERAGDAMKSSSSGGFLTVFILPFETVGDCLKIDPATSMLIG